MPVDSERRCYRCSTYLNEDEPCCPNQYCSSNRETLRALTGDAAASRDDIPEAYRAVNGHMPKSNVPYETHLGPTNHALDQDIQADGLQLDLFSDTDVEDVTPVETPQAMTRYPERSKSDIRTRGNPNAADADDEEPNSSTG